MAWAGSAQCRSGITGFATAALRALIARAGRESRATQFRETHPELVSRIDTLPLILFASAARVFAV